MPQYHVAFLPFPVSGHVDATLPVVAELARRGHRVTFATNARFAPLAAEAGASVLCCESAFDARDPLGESDGDCPVREPARSFDAAPAAVPIFEAGFGGDLPDVLLYDVGTSAAGRVLARKWRRQAIELFPAFASNEHYSPARRTGAMCCDRPDPARPAPVDLFAKQERLLRDNGLSGVTPEELNAPAEEANLVFVPRRFQPEHATFDERFAFVGPCIGRRPDAADWHAPGDGCPLLVVSTGSLGCDHQREFIRTCLEAFADTQWHVVMSVGRQIDLTHLAVVPDNVQLLRWVPLSKVLERADAFITHAGMHSVMEALYFGTPMVAVPHVPEQWLVARRLEELGFGVRLPETGVSAKRLRETVAALAADERIGARVRAMSAEMREKDGPSLAADFIEAQAARRVAAGE